MEKITVRLPGNILLEELTFKLPDNIYKEEIIKLNVQLLHYFVVLSEIGGITDISKYLKKIKKELNMAISEIEERKRLW